MKTNFRSIVLVSGFMVLGSGIYASTSAPIDPDAAIYSALNTLSNSPTLSLADAATLSTLIPTAKSFLTGSTSSSVTLSNLDTWLTTVNGVVSSDTAAAAAAATVAKFTNDVNALKSSTNLVGDISTILSKYATATGLATADVTTLYNAIITAANAALTQTPTSLSAYLASLTTMLTTAKGSSILAAQASGLANAVSVITKIASVDSSGALYVTKTPVTLTDISNLLNTANFVTAVQAWRALKSGAVK